MTNSTNYFNTLIEIAADSSATTGIIPPAKGDKRTVANLQFEMLTNHPYEYTSDDVLFGVFAERNGIPADKRQEERARFFSKGQPCLRASPLTKSYGWGIHSNADGKIAMVPVESEEYQNFVVDESVTKTKAMRSKRR